MNLKRKIVWAIVLTCLAITWLPFFGIFNEAKFIGPLPQPLAVTLAANVVLTLCVIALYPLYFKPFLAALKRDGMEK